MKITGPLYLLLASLTIALLAMRCGGDMKTAAGGASSPQRLSWKAPTSRVDPTLPPLTEQDLKEYRLYYGTSSGKYDNFVSLGTSTSVGISDPVIQNLQLKPGTTYYIAVTYVDTMGRESGYSDEKSFFYPAQ